MDRADRDSLLQEVVELVQRVVPATSKPIRPSSGLLTEFDLDSLGMLELTELIRAEYGVDLLAPPHSMADLSTPMTVVDAIVADHDRRQ